MFRSLPLFLLLLGSFGLQAQSLWTAAPENGIPSVGERRIQPQVYRTFKLDLSAAQSVLASAAERFSANAAESETILELPMPDGNTAHFRIEESSVMAPELQSRYPEIRCYTGWGIENPTSYLKCDLTPWGFHGMISTPGQSPVYIDPYRHGNRDFYTVYYKKDYLPSKKDLALACDTQDDGFVEIKNEYAAEAQSDCQLRHYRLALACTGEYAAFHGGTKALAMAAMNTSLNRVNGVYETELSVTMQLVPKNDTLIFLNAGNDPYTNNNGSTMLTQNVTTCNARIGFANYDIGHVFSTGGGGIANLRSVCSDTKAQGVTGSPAPVGDPFDIDYVVHEMGHQFGAQHTQNNNCNRVSGSAVEPGSASTIMGYAGICAPDVQPHSDPYFHGLSLQQINAFLVGSGDVCAVKTSNGNTSPSVNGGADYVIPKSTYFALTATGSDQENDNLTYCWEQMDPEFATMPPVSTSTTGPLFRSFLPTASPTRYFPNLTDIVNNGNPTWEKLPSVARTMKFRVTLRDNHSGSGCTDQDDVLVTVASNAGPFQVTAPNTAVTWFVGDTKAVTWSVSNTNIAPVNCSNVRISLSTDGGYTYPFVLANSVPNTGTANVVIPNQISSTCRIKVEAVGNIFFDISNQNFSIQASATPLFLMSVNPLNLSVCAGDQAKINVNLESILGFNTPVNVSVSGLPAGATAQASPNPLTPTGAVTLTLDGLTSAANGNYTLVVSATGGTVTRTESVLLTLLPGAPTASVNTPTPADGALNQQPSPAMGWNAVTYADGYDVEISTNPTFPAGASVYAETVSGTSIQPILQAATVYYWRVRPANQCGAGQWSSTFSFQTTGTLCNQVFNSIDVPKAISSTAAVTVTSKVTVPSTASLTDVNVSLKIDHTYTGDLSAKLIAPWGQTYQLFDRPGVPADTYGCDNPNVDLVFDDAATLNADALENACDGSGIALFGTYQPINSLLSAAGHSAQGDWTMSVSDAFADDGGALTAWGLNLCFASALPVGAVTVNQVLIVPQGGTGTINNNYLVMSTSGTADLGVFTVLSLPAHGTLYLNGTPLSAGATFTQAEINAGLLTYKHNGDNAQNDVFHFDALDQSNNAWFHNGVFSFYIAQNNLSASAAQTAPILCAGGSDAQITVTATGLNGQYMYLLSSGAQQSTNVFSGLSAGSYTVTVSGQFGFTATTNVVVISAPTAVSANASVNISDVTAAGSGGTAPYTYSIDGTNFQSDATFSGLSNGVYTVVVKDANGCTATAEAIVAVNTLVATAQIASSILCAGGSEGSIQVSVGGGETPFTYSLNGVDFQSSATFSGLSAGTYQVIVRDNQGFETQTSVVTLLDPTPVSASASAALNVITAQASGGTGAFTYSIDGTNFQSGNTFGGLSNGDYLVTARDANGCTATAVVSVNVPPLEISAGATGQILCFGDFTGSIMAFGTGGIPPYQYRLGTGDFQSGNIFSGLAAGSYDVTIRDDFGSEVVTTVVITTPDPLSLDIILNDNNASLNISGGTVPYTYTLNDVPGAPLSDLPPAVYTVVVTDANGCSTSGGFEILGNTIVVSVESTQTPSCHGAADGRAVICVNGGYAPLTVLGITPNNGAIINTIGGACALNIEVTQLPAGFYSLEVGDNAGFTQTVSFTINLVAELTATAVSASDSIIVSASGGTPGYQYSLDGVNYQASPIFTGLTPGVYGVRVVDANGCLAVIENVIIVSGTTEPGIEWGMALTPNPSSGLFRLSMNHAPNALQLRVTDAAGRVLHTVDYQVTGSVFAETIDLANMPQGVYFLLVSDGNQRTALRLSVIK